MSQLERLAEAVVQVGKLSGPVLQSVAQAGQGANRTAASVPNDEAGYSRTIRTQLYEGVAALQDVERLLADFDKRADAFAKRLVGGAASTSPSGPGGLQGGEENSDEVSLTADQTDFVGSELRTTAGSAFYAADDHRMRRSALSLDPFPGEYTLDLHGTPDTVVLAIGGTVKTMNATDFARVIRSGTSWKGQPIRLFSCNTGQYPDGFAQQLADALGVKVTAPDKPAWGGGGATPVVSDAVWKLIKGTWRRTPMVPPNGHWISFTPRKGKS